MKPFNLEKAKAGAPVVCERHPSRNHVPARILCFDALGQNPIVALVTNEGDEETETAVRLNLSGISAYHTLFMAPVKRAGWIIIETWEAKNRSDRAVFLDSTHRLKLGSESLFETEEQAREFLGPVDDYHIAKVEWWEAC